MAESSRWWNTNNTGDGPSSGTGYSQQQWYDAWRKVLTPNAVSDGVLAGESNELVVNGGTSPLVVATGSAIVYGFFYENTSPISLTVATPAVPTGGHVILRANWAAQTVRAIAVLNTSGVTTPPALTQSAGTTWEIRLASFIINNSGAITLTDTRSFCHFGTYIARGRVDGLAAGRVPFGDTAGKLTESSGLVYDNTNNTLLTSTLTGLGSTAGSEQAVTSAQGTVSNLLALRTVLRRVANGTSWDTAAIILRRIVDITTQAYISFFGSNVGINTDQPAEALDVAGRIKVSPAAASAPLVLGPNGQNQKVLGLHADGADTLKLQRQGGDATNWGNSSAVTNYTPATMRMQAGAFQSPGSAAASGSFTITFPTAFGGTPLVFANSVGSDVTLAAGASASTLFVSWWSRSGAATNPPAVTWLAIGPE